MSKLYQNSSNLSSPFSKLYLNFCNKVLPSYSFMPLPFLNFLPSFVISILRKESIIFQDLASLIAPNYQIGFDSAVKKIKRFLSNSNYDFDFFFSNFISNIISNYKIKHDDNRVRLLTK